MRIAVKAALFVAMLMGIYCGESRAQDANRPGNLNGALPSVLGSPDLAGNGKVELTSGTYAIFHTSAGDFIAVLRPEWAPQAVQNFTALATGQKRWRHPVSQEETTRPLYSNTTIYRIVPNGMICGGDPLGKGEADSGTQLPLEVANGGGQFTEPGLLAMDNSGDRVSGSRWFVTLRPLPERSGTYSTFGKVIGGLDTVQKISFRPVKRPQLPLDPVMVFWVEIVRIPPGRVTSGEFQMVDGLKVLRINPNFQDAPIAPVSTPQPVAEEAATTDTESEEAEATTKPDSAKPNEQEGDKGDRKRR